MKKLFYLVILMALLQGCFKKMAQSGMADPKDELAMLKKNLTSGIIDQLKTTKTVFFLQKDNTGKNDSIQAALSSVWDLTPLVFDDISNFGKYAGNPQYSYFVIEGNTTTVRMTQGSYSNTHYYLVLRLFKDADMKGKNNSPRLCRIELYPSWQTIQLGEFGYNSELVVDKLYDKGHFYNWSPVLLKAQLASAQTNIKSKIRPWLFEEINDPQLTRLISKDTLYVPQHLKINSTSLTAMKQVIPKTCLQAMGLNTGYAEMLSCTGFLKRKNAAGCFLSMLKVQRTSLSRSTTYKTRKSFIRNTRQQAII